jgi:hypothetical protein
VRTLYRPLGLLFGVVGGVVASAIFAQIWKQLSGDDEAPDATDPDRDWHEVLLAAAIEGAVFGLVKAAIDRGGAKGWERLTGVWPGGDDDE